MALRKMLGRVDQPEIVHLMRLIETQSKQTLTRFSAEYVAEHYLPIAAELAPDEIRLQTAVTAVEEYMTGGALQALKAAVRDARTAAQEQKDPVCQAAARAVATACAVAVTPTNALGFAFYGAAAYAYHTAGVKAGSDVYDALADEELRRIGDALERACVPDEPDPVRISWNC